MLCPACKSDLPADSAFCPKCGQRIGNAPTGASVQQVAAPPAAVAPTAAEKMRAATPAAPHQPEPEHELWHGGISPKAMIGSWVLAGIITIAAAVAAVMVPNPITWIAAAVIVPLAWLIPAIRYLALRLGVEYKLTTQRFMHKQGLLSRASNQILLVDIDDVSYRQQLLERIFNIGTITLISNDTTDPKLNLLGIDDVQRVADLIDEARREERRKRAIYMASA
jgi:membrane protein YdbS with pleckstrin-like domain